MYVLRPEKFIHYKSIERDVEQIIGISEKKLKCEIRQPPIPVEKIAEFVFDIRVEWCDSLPSDASGETLGQIDPNKGIIEINASLLLNQPARRNFTIAHELGHFHLHYQYVNDDTLTKPHHLFDMNAKNEYRPRKTLERQADYFASALLAPRHM